MSAQPIHEAPDPLDPAAILQDLPERYHHQFLAEYEAAVEVARKVDGYGHLHDVLKLWRWNAGIYSDPTFHALERAARSGDEASPLEQVMPADIKAEYDQLFRRVLAQQMSVSLNRLRRLTAAGG